MKIAINRCYGGFCLSNKGFLELIKRGWRVTVYNDDFEPVDPTAELIDKSGDERFRPMLDHSHYNFTADRSNKELRTHPDILAVIEELGPNANTLTSKLRIVEVPDDVDWIITDHDGFEQVEEVHRIWS
ncbi:RimK family alpha-L-glutamate ligase [Brevibacillus sp. IT-7CA2]|uniref:hypothetical protein n=1 Tax=Brevibacillus sp. IT-7CA2 TaxID=3026436 RepID=UPI0039E03809